MCVLQRRQSVKWGFSIFKLGGKEVRGGPYKGEEEGNPLVNSGTGCMRVTSHLSARRAIEN